MTFGQINISCTPARAWNKAKGVRTGMCRKITASSHFSSAKKKATAEKYRDASGFPGVFPILSGSSCYAYSSACQTHNVSLVFGGLKPPLSEEPSLAGPPEVTTVEESWCGLAVTRRHTRRHRKLMMR